MPHFAVSKWLWATTYCIQRWPWFFDQLAAGPSYNMDFMLGGDLQVRGPAILRTRTVWQDRHNRPTRQVDLISVAIRTPVSSLLTAAAGRAKIHGKHMGKRGFQFDPIRANKKREKRPENSRFLDPLRGVPDVLLHGRSKADVIDLQH